MLSATSAWISPSMSRSSSSRLAISFARAVAAAMRFEELVGMLPWVEWLSMAIRGVLPRMWCASLPVSMAIPASSLMVGSGLTPQSARRRRPSLPKCSRCGAVMATTPNSLGSVARGLMKWMSER